MRQLLFLPRYAYLMFQRLIVHFIHIIQHIRNFLLSSIFIYLLWILCQYSSSSYAASLPTYSSHRSQPLEFLSNPSYRQSMLRQYLLEQLHIPFEQRACASIFLLDHSFAFSVYLISGGYQRRRRSLSNSANDALASLSSSSIITIPSMNCLENKENHHIYFNYLWSHSKESIDRLELIYQIDAKTGQGKKRIPIQILFKQVHSYITLWTIDAQLDYDTNRSSYVLSLNHYLPRLQNRQILIEAILFDQTCATSNLYLIATRSFSAPPTPSSSSCTLRTILIDFEELGMAHWIIRPKQYLFTYCNGTCSSSHLSLQSTARFSLHALLQSILHRKDPQLPETKCAPMNYDDEHFLLRNDDGTIYIDRIPNILVKQCACL